MQTQFFMQRIANFYLYFFVYLFCLVPNLLFVSCAKLVSATKNCSTLNNNNTQKNVRNWMKYTNFLHLQRFFLMHGQCTSHKRFTI